MDAGRGARRHRSGTAPTSAIRRGGTQVRTRHSRQSLIRPRRISAVRDVVIARSVAQVLDVVRDIQLLEPLERKARSVEIHPTRDGRGWYRIVGKLFGIRGWEGDFSYEQHENGWHSEDLHPREDGWRISGGFLVSRIDDATSRVTHYEDYTVPARLWYLQPLLASYLRRSQVGEMRDLAVLVERAARGSEADASGWGVER